MSANYTDFDPNGIGFSNGNLYGLPFAEDEARLVIIPVPWEVTVSYNSGTASAPEAILEASLQVDLYDPFVNDAWKMGLAMLQVDSKIKAENFLFRQKAEEYINQLSETGKNTTQKQAEILSEINNACSQLNEFVYKNASRIIANNQIPAVLGGDHSTPLGLLKALSEKHFSFGILHIDAHADLREAYEDFTYSHASIMFNALKIKQISNLVQVGIRDYCENEAELIHKDQRITTFFDRDLKRELYSGTTWHALCQKITDALPQQVYISFDIDGLDPKLCPGTGTPVSGGLELDECLYLFEMIVNSGRTIIGFDLVEVAPGETEWDANVGARLLYRLSNLCLYSQK
jgi:agmatinase